MSALSVPPIVSAARRSPLTVVASTPAGGIVVRIRVFRLGAETAFPRRVGKRAARRKLVASVLRGTPRAKRYRFRLTERKLRRLRPGRYQVEVSVGRTLGDLGPARIRNVTVR